jgi:subfamily B ATP-binding cassette protein MsbA
VVELGTHEELLKLQGRYTYLYTAQFARNHWRSGGKLAPAQPLNRWSYEMRSELNVLLGALQLLADDLVEDDLEASELVQAAYRATLNLLPVMASVEEHCGQS